MTRQRRLHAFSEGLLDPKHVQTIGEALWTFLWCIARQTPASTNPDNEPGWLLKGEEFPLSRITRRLGIADRTARRHLARLGKAEYITLIRGQHGVRIKVLNPHKFRHDATHSSPVTYDRSHSQNQPPVDKAVENSPDRSPVTALRSVTHGRQSGHLCPIASSYQINRSRDIPTSGAVNTHATAGTEHRASGGTYKGKHQDRLYPYRDMMGNLHVASQHDADEHHQQNPTDDSTVVVDGTEAQEDAHDA